MADIYVFGDSIGYGAIDSEGGWVDRLKKYFHKKKIDGGQFTEVYNMSVDGDTSSDVAKRIYSELAARRKPWSTSDDLVIVAVGGNDTVAEGKENNYRASAGDYKDNLVKIHKAIEAFGLKVMVVSITAVDESLTNPCSWGAYYVKNERVEEFNKAQEAFCKEYNIERIDFFQDTLTAQYRSKLCDGVHPDSEGHTWLYDQISPAIIDKIEALT